jgi:hypothetical protein
MIGEAENVDIDNVTEKTIFPRCVEWRQTWKMRVITKNFSADKPTWDFGSYVT